jgi:DNA-binding response OmpR family regulator
MREHTDLILLDVNMPGMSGLEACSKIRLSFTGPIIMVSVRNSEQDKIQALDSGADDYVVKPFTTGNFWHVSEPRCDGPVRKNRFRSSKARN